MLKKALKADLPLITVTTRDTVNISTVLAYLSDKKPFELEDSKLVPSVDYFRAHIVPPGSLFFCVGPSVDDYEYLYEQAIEHESTLVLVNPVSEDRNNVSFDAGEAGVPTGLMTKFLIEFIGEENTPRVSRLFGGMTIKEIAEVCRLSSSNYGDLAVESISMTIQEYRQPLIGLQPVCTDVGYYYPSAPITNWLEEDGRAFIHKDCPQEIRPRGLLLTSIPGLGKTMAAKYIASTLGIPLYRLELGSLLGRYVGDSEKNMRNALQLIAQHQPCVMLIDEVEKYITKTDNDGVSNKLLAQLLWWLQEHKAQVLTIFTCNDKDKLPPELIRPGRVDEVINLQPLTITQGVSFIHWLIHHLDMEELNLDVEGLVKSSMGSDGVITHAALTSGVHKAVRRSLVR